MRPWRGRTPRNSLAGSRYEPKNGPPILVAFARSWGLPEPLTQHWWRALCAARWSQARQWREQVIAFTPESEEARTFVEGDCSPRVLVQVLENLVAEGTLLRPTASAIEAKLLAHVDA